MDQRLKTHTKRLNDCTDMVFEAMADDNPSEVMASLEEMRHVLNIIEKEYGLS